MTDCLHFTDRLIVDMHLIVYSNLRKIAPEKMSASENEFLQTMSIEAIQKKPHLTSISNKFHEYYFWIGHLFI